MKLGTSSLVVAAFVGPGTVLTCASAGVRFGYALGWVLLFATAAAFVLQSFTAGTGILARQGLGEAMRAAVPAGSRRALLFGLVVLGLWVGCAAFEAGNLLGAAAGVQTILGPAVDVRWLVGGMGAAAGVLLLLDLRVLLRVLTLLVGVMSLLFIATLGVAPVDWSQAARLFFGVGLLAAGLTSAVTAPLAAAAGIRELFDWPADPRHGRTRLVWLTVLLSGLFFGLTGVSPLTVIVAAQAANGLLLPFLAGFVLYLTVRQQAVPVPRWYVAAGLLVTAICAGLGIRTLWWVWGQLGASG